jgi:hypothetical protein
MGGLYASYDELDYEDLYCGQCGDSDWLIGYAGTREQAWNLLKEDGWDYDYIQEFIHSNWDNEEEEEELDKED